MGQSLGYRMGRNHRGRKNLGEPKTSDCQEESWRLSVSSGAIGVSSDSSSQKASSAAVAFFGLPAMTAALKAPMEIPATRSGWIPRCSSARTTPHSKAPSAPPPCRINTVCTANFASGNAVSASLSAAPVRLVWFKISDSAA